MKLQKKINKEGRTGSAVLPPRIINYLMDIDGTVGEDIPNEEAWRMADSIVYPDAIVKINEWYDEGHIITFFTSRTEEHREVTETWLKKHGFKYHGLLMGKPRGGNYHWIDDRDVQVTQFYGNWKSPYFRFRLFMRRIFKFL